MVAQFLRLKLTLLGNSFRRSPWQFVGLALSVLYGLGTSTFVVAGMSALRFFDVDLARSAVVVLGSFILVLYATLPLVLGIDDTLDPRKFALFSLPTTQLARNLAIAALVSVPAIVITIIAFAQVTTWSRGPLPVFIALISAVLIIATAVLSARISTAIASFLLSTRRARDLSGLIGLFLLIGLAPVIVFLVNVDWLSEGLDVLARVADVAAWTPLGLAWAAPAEAAASDPQGAFVKLLLAAAWVGVLWFAWRALVGVILVTPVREAHARKYVGLGWFDWLPRTPTGAIAARSLTYWGRDSRYGTSFVVIPLIPLIMVVALVIGGLPLQQLALLPLPVMCLFLSWSIHNDVAFDNTAIWLHLSTSTSGRADRWGRLIPVLLVGVPLVAVGSFVTAWAFGDWTVLPAVVGVSTCILFTGLGLSSVMSARFPYPAVRPGDSPFAQPQGTGSPAGPIQAVSFFAILFFTAPVLAASVLGLVEDPSWHLVALASGVGIGTVVLVGGAFWGGYIYDRRTSQLLAFSMQN